MGLGEKQVSLAWIGPEQVLAFPVSTLPTFDYLLSFSPVQIVPGLPKTRSGKIMRRILRKIAADQHDDLGDVSTLADPSVVEAIVKKHTQNQQ